MVIKPQCTATPGTALVHYKSHVGFVLVFPVSSLLAGSSSREDLWHFAESFRYWFPLEHLLLCEMIEATSRLPPWMFAAAAQLIICYIYLNSKKIAWILTFLAPTCPCICSQVDLEAQQPALLGCSGPWGKIPFSNSPLKPQTGKINPSISLTFPHIHSWKSNAGKIRPPMHSCTCLCPRAAVARQGNLLGPGLLLTNSCWNCCLFEYSSFIRNFIWKSFLQGLLDFDQNCFQKYG